MPHALEYPGAGGFASWDSLYRARGDEVEAHRPVFTGDVFQGRDTRPRGNQDQVDHDPPASVRPAYERALRTNGVDLQPRLMVVEVRTHRLIPAEDWTGHVSKMPLPELAPTVTSGRRHQAAFFDELYLVAPDDLVPEKRVACLSQTGVNLMLQRWVNHNSRAVIPTGTYHEVSSPSYEEADLTEEWCEERLSVGITVPAATVEAVKWLRGDGGRGMTYQQLLEDPQRRSAVRKDMRAALRALRR